MRFSNETDANSLIQNIFDHDNTSGWNQTVTNHISTSSSGSVRSKIFFIFPIMGLLVLCYGSCYLRNRRIQQSRQSSQIYDARLRATEERIRIRKALRLEMVENALVTTKVVRRKSIHLLDTSRSSWGSTALSSVIESVCEDMDEEAPASISRESDEKIENGHNSSKCSVAASQVLNAATESLTLEHPIGMDGCVLEASVTCAICLESYQENDSVSYSRHKNCTHAFHTECIMNWLTCDQYRNDCPCCRSQYVHVCVVESDDDIFEAETSGNPSTDEEQAETSNQTEQYDTVSSEG